MHISTAMFKGLIVRDKVEVISCVCFVHPDNSFKITFSARSSCGVKQAVRSYFHVKEVLFH